MAIQMIAYIQPDGTYLMNGQIVTLEDVMQYPYRVHLANGDVEIYEAAGEIQASQPMFDILSYEAEVNALHDDLFRSLYQPRKYQDLADIKSWADLIIAADDPNQARKLFYKQEANALRDWWIDTYLLIEDHLALVTEATANAQAFIASLPSFTYD